MAGYPLIECRPCQLLARRDCDHRLERLAFESYRVVELLRYHRLQETWTSHEGETPVVKDET